MSDTEKIVDEAARWIVRNQDRPAPAVLKQLGHWLTQSGGHMRAYLRLSRIWITTDLTHPVRPADQLIEVVRAKLRDEELVRPAERAARGATPSLRRWLLSRWRKRYVLS